MRYNPSSIFGGRLSSFSECHKMAMCVDCWNSKIRRNSPDCLMVTAFGLLRKQSRQIEI